MLEDALRRHVCPEGGGLTVDELPVTEAVDSLGGSFPGWLRVPAWLRPTDYTLFLAVRPLTDQPSASARPPDNGGGVLVRCPGYRSCFQKPS